MKICKLSFLMFLTFDSDRISDLQENCKNTILYVLSSNTHSSDKSAQSFSKPFIQFPSINMLPNLSFTIIFS